MKKRMIIVLIAISPLLASFIPAQNKLPNLQDRIYSLSLIWRELHYSFAFPETLQKVNLDSLYIDYLPKVEGATNSYEYYRTLCSFLAHFNEAHTRIYTSHRPDDMPPITVVNFGKKIIVSNIAKSFADHIPLGSEIVKVNQIPVEEYIRDSVFQYIAAATPHWKFDKSVTEMFYGVPFSTVNITIKPQQGKEKDVTLIRNYYSNGSKEQMLDTTRFSPIEIRIIDGKIGYIKLTSFVGQYLDKINSVFNSNLPQLRKCKGLIIDIQGNRGGTDEAWENIASHLILQSKFQTKGKWYSRKSIPTYKMWGEYNSRFRDYYKETSMEEIQHAPYINKLDDSLKLHQPLVVISGQYVGSSSEDFLALIKEMNRGVIVGEPSVGCIGEPMFIPLPGNLAVMICAKKYVNPDGTQPNATGILPDVFEERDYNAYLKGKDNVLDRAINVLKQLINE